MLVAAAATAAVAQPDDAPTAAGRISYGTAHIPQAALCSGTLVAPDLVLTAAHCVRGAQGTPATILFSAGLRDGHAVATATGRQIIIASGDGIAADVALVRLDHPLPNVTPLRLGPESGPRLTRFAYRRDRPETVDRDDLCLILQEDGPVIRLGCGAVTGHSGAAVLSLVDGDWQVAGVMVARVRQGIGSIAVRVPDDLAQTIALAAE